MPLVVLPNQTVVPAVETAQPTGSSRDAIGVCLDYAMGTCTRNHCKYPHPDPTPLHRMREQYGHQGVVCEVYALTGHCRFGAKCTKMHPAIAPPPWVPSPIPLPPQTVGHWSEMDAPPMAATASSPMIPALPQHVTSHVAPAVRPVAAADGLGLPVPTPSEERPAPQLDAFTTVMRQSLEPLEGHLPAQRPAAPVPLPDMAPPSPLPAAQPVAATDALDQPESSSAEEQKAPLFEAFATDMRQSLEQLEGHQLGMRSPALAPVPIPDTNLRSNGMDEIFLDIMHDLRGNPE